MRRNIYKNLMGFLLLLTGSFQIGFANPHNKILSTYSETLSSITNGNTVRAIVFLDKCKAKTNSLLPNGRNIAGFSFTNVNAYQIDTELGKKNVIATSIDVLVEHAKLGPVHSYLRLRIFEDNSVEIFSEYLDPRTFSKLGPSVSLNCNLSTKEENKGVVLYEFLPA